MIQRILFLSYALLLVFTTEAQILDNSQFRLFGDKPFFNEDFIQSNKIRLIRGSISTKRELQPIRNQGMLQEFHFDEQGRLVRQLETIQQQNSADTTRIFYQYDDIQRLVTELQTTNKSFHSYQYEYDSLNNVVAQNYSHGNYSDSLTDSLKTHEHLVKTDRFSYAVLSPNQVRKTYYNSVGKPFKENIIIRDSLGNIQEENTRFIVTNRHINTFYTYDEMMRLKEVREESDVIGMHVTLYQYTYDEVGNIYEEKTIKNGKEKTLKQFLYSPQSMVLNAMLIKDIETNIITIIQYSYEYDMPQASK